MIQLTEKQIEDIRAMREKAGAKTISYWEIYQKIADMLVIEHKFSSSDPTVKWLRGATEANANRGSMAALIRAYTDTQYRLRYGKGITDAQMQ